MKLAYYISGHGFGHAVRSVEIISHLPRETQLHIKSMAPEWFFRQELDRPFECYPQSFDCGVVQSDDEEIDRHATLHAVESLYAEADTLIAHESAWLRDNGIGLVVCDVPAIPIAAARRAGIPTVAVANFTWADIYREYIPDFPEFQPIVERIEEQYRLTDTLLRVEPAFPLDLFPNRETFPPVGRRGTPRRDDLARTAELDPNKKWWLFYPGNLGMAFEWQALAAIPGAEFLTYREPPVELSNVTLIAQDAFPHKDVTASVDGVISKAGYSMLCECMANATPMLYTDRDHFAEYAVMHEALQRWEGGLFLNRDDFTKGRWRDSLERLATLRPAPLPESGGRLVAERLTQLYLHTTARHD